MQVVVKTGLLLGALAGCTTFEDLGRPPSMTSVQGSSEQIAMLDPGIPLSAAVPPSAGSLWDGGRNSLLGDRRAVVQGDILTVVIEIDDSAEISNNTSRSRSANESVSIPNLLGIPQRINPSLPAGATLDNAVGVSSSGSSSGDGSVRRSEKLELKVAATVTNVLPNGILAITGRQEVRVNFELRELTISGFVRPEDISRQNAITYDKIASARISYGGRGLISSAQQPRVGTQIIDRVSPF